jgi:hypothetical protein
MLDVGYSGSERYIVLGLYSILLLDLYNTLELTSLYYIIYYYCYIFYYYYPIFHYFSLESGERSSRHWQELGINRLTPGKTARW